MQRRPRRRNYGEQLKALVPWSPERTSSHELDTLCDRPGQPQAALLLNLVDGFFLGVE